MTDLALPGSIEPAVKRPNLDKGFNPLTMILFGGILAGGLLFVAYSLYADVEAAGTRVTSYVPYILLFVALLIALGFEFVNGFHDTANAVATVIYTQSLPAEAAVLSLAGGADAGNLEPGYAVRFARENPGSGRGQHPQ